MSFFLVQFTVLAVKSYIFVPVIRRVKVYKESPDFLVHVCINVVEVEIEEIRVLYYG